jgi:hypothetical protein
MIGLLDLTNIPTDMETNFIPFSSLPLAPSGPIFCATTIKLMKRNALILESEQ